MSKYTLIAIFLFIATFLLNQSAISSEIKVPSTIDVELFTTHPEKTSAQLTSDAIIESFKIYLNTEKPLSIRPYKEKLVLFINKKQTEYDFPSEIVMSAAEGGTICLKTSKIKERCYRGKVKIRNDKGYITLINVIRFDDYIKAVGPGEIPPSWPQEAIKAQLVAIKTFALQKILSGQKIGDSTQFQFYGGANYEKQTINKLYEEIKDYIIVDRNNKPIEALYHSTCAGKTQNNEDVFSGNKIDYLRSTRCKYCKDSNFYKEKEYKISKIGFFKKLNTRNLDIKGSKKKNFTVETGEKDYSRYQFWLKLGQILGWGAVPGINYDVDCGWFCCSIRSKGAGHGVGMCQWGAKGLAEKGKRFDEILKYYYHDVKVIPVKNVF